jgi:hypothetical protein
MPIVRNISRVRFPGRVWPHSYEWVHFSNESRSGSSFIGVSFGDYEWIDTSLPCECTPLQRWRNVDTSLFGVEHTYTFEIFKSPADFKIIIHSKHLQRHLQEGYKSNLELLCNTTTEPSKMFNGLVLLKHRASLVSHLGSFSLAEPGLVWASELSLLVNGVLGDAELFESFGYSQLLKEGRLTRGLWKTFEVSRVHRHIDALKQLQDMPNEEAICLSTVDASGHLCSGMDSSVTPRAGISGTSKIPRSNFAGRVFSHIWRANSYQETDSSTSDQAASGLESAEEEIQELLHLGAFCRSSLPPKHEAHTPLSITGLALQYFLLRAVLEGDTRAVDAVFRIAIITHDSKTKPTGLHVDLDWADGNRTLLHAAVRGGHQNIVKLLLDKGADVDVVTDTETALCVAAQMRDESAIHLLLDRGADYGTAELLLRMPESKALGAHHLNRLRAYVARYKRNGLVEKRTKAMQLRFQFWREHQHIKLQLRRLLQSFHLTRGTGNLVYWDLTYWGLADGIGRLS